MGFERNKAVDRLRQYIPFQTAHGSLYDEYVEHGAGSLHVDTRALSYVKTRLESGTSRLIVLTGDAGHGKTHLCRRLLDELGDDAARSQEWLRLNGDGSSAFQTNSGTCPSLRIIKDLSELDFRRALDLLRTGVHGHGAPLVVCANEGILRDAVAAAGGTLDVLRATLEESVRRGVTSIERGIHVVNLNYQSVGAPECSIVSDILKSWMLASRWQTCRRCDAEARCPIVFNRDELGGRPADHATAAQRREALRLLLQIVEESGQVVTFRELLIFTAYLITGGLSCRDVEVHCRARRDNDWQFAYTYSQLAFEPPLSPDQRRGLALFDALGRLDPGRQAVRVVDDPLAAESVEAATGAFRPPQRELEGTSSRTRRSALEAAERFRRHMAFQRRRDYFELATGSIPRAPGAPEASRATRLGLRHYDDFDFLRKWDGTTDRSRYIQLRDRLITGLHAVQGAHVGANRVLSLHLVDPAFARDQKAATIIARQIRATDVSIEPERRAWRRRSGSEPELPTAVDWLDRRLVARFGEASRAELVLDLLQFEYVLRAAEGLSCRSFFRADIRRIMATLSQLVDEGDGDRPDIQVLKAGRVQTIVIDHGIIRAGEG